MSSRRRLDLNLIRVFVTIYETRSVGLAGERLALSQPTVSYGLAKLRRELQDTLFIRTRDGMEPTAYATRLHEEFATALSRIDRIVEASQDFDPATSNRRFAIAMSDIGELIFLPPILERMSIEAPHAEIEVIQTSDEDLRRRLATGEVSAAVGNLPALVRDTEHEPLFEERYVCLVRKDHSVIGQKITRAQYSQARHVHVKSRFSGHGVLEDDLRSQGVYRDLSVTIPHFGVLGQVTVKSDLVATLPSRVAKLFELYMPVRSVELPVKISPFHVLLHWDKNDERNFAHAWFRQLVRTTLRTI